MQRNEEKNPPSEGNPRGSCKETAGNTEDSKSTVCGSYDPGHHDDGIPTTRTMENTYRLGPNKLFPVSAVEDILKDVLTTNLQSETYEAEWSQQMTMTLSEVIKARVKDLADPRYKIVVWVTIGQLAGQSMQISSRCLWDTTKDTYVSYSFKNSSLYAVAIVYAVYYE